MHSIAPNPVYDTCVRLKEMKDYKNPQPNLIMYYISDTMPRSFYMRYLDLSPLFEKKEEEKKHQQKNTKSGYVVCILFFSLYLFSGCCFVCLFVCFSVLFCTLIKGITPQIRLLCFGIMLLDKRSFEFCVCLELVMDR